MEIFGMKQGWCWWNKPLLTSQWETFSSTHISSKFFKHYCSLVECKCHTERKRPDPAQNTGPATLIIWCPHHILNPHVANKNTPALGTLLVHYCSVKSYLTNEKIIANECIFCCLLNRSTSYIITHIYLGLIENLSPGHRDSDSWLRGDLRNIT